MPNTMRLISSLLIVLCALFALGAAPQAVDQHGHTFDPDSIPVVINQDLMCKSCYAAVKVFVRTYGPKLAGIRNKMTREVFVYDAMCVGGRGGRSHG